MPEDRPALSLEERVREKEAQYAALLGRPGRGLALAALLVAAVLHALVLAPGVLSTSAAGASASGSEPRRLLASLPAPPAGAAPEAAPHERALRTLRPPAIPDPDPAQAPFPAIDTGGEPPEADILPVEPEPGEPPIQVPAAAGETTPPTLIAESRVDPVYPELAKRGAYGATLVLRALVLASGDVSEVTVLRSSRPNLGFESAAIRAIRQWRYQPAVRAGRPVDAYVYVNVHFRPSK